MSCHGHLQRVRVDSVAQPLTAISPETARLPLVRIEHGVLGNVVWRIAGKETREDQMTLVAIDILVSVAIDEAAVHAAVGMQIDDKVYLICLPEGRPIE